MARVVPPVSYFGGKQKSLNRILPLLPTDREGYVEPFCGGAAVYFGRSAVRAETINDLDRRLTDFYIATRDHCDELVEKIVQTPYSEWEYIISDEIPPSLPIVERARRYYIRVALAMWNLARPGATFMFSYFDGNGRPMVAKFDRVNAERVIRIAQKRMVNTQILNRDAIDVINWFSNPNYVCYVDPPYADAVGKDSYLHEDVDHEELSNALHNYKGYAAISGYPTETMLELYKDWHQFDYSRRVESATNRGKNDAVDRIETVWTNQEPPVLEQGSFF